MGRMGDQEIKGDLEIFQTSPYPNIQPVGPQVSLVKLHKHLSVLSPPHHLLISCPSQNSSSPAKLAHQVPSLPPPGLRAKSHSYSKSFCRSPSIPRAKPSWCECNSRPFFPCFWRPPHLSTNSPARPEKPICVS